MTRWFALLLCVASCGNITRKQDDAGVKDDAPTDARPIDAPDARMIDAPPPPPPPESREIVSGGNRLTGTTYTMDVQIGHPIQQSQMTGTTYRLEGNAAIKQ